MKHSGFWLCRFGSKNVEKPFDTKKLVVVVVLWTPDREEYEKVKKNIWENVFFCSFWNFKSSRGDDGDFFCCSLWFEQVYMKWRCRKHLFVIERIGEWLQIYEREKGDRHLKCFPFCFVFGYSNVIFSSLIFLFVICIYRSHEKLNAFASAAPLTSRGNPADFLFLAASMMSAELRLFPLPPTHSVSLMPVPTGRIDLSHKLSQEIDGQREMMVEFFSAEMVDRVCAK